MVLTKARCLLTSAVNKLNDPFGALFSNPNEEACKMWIS
jgi:hypothetical protein